MPIHSPRTRQMASPPQHSTQLAAAARQADHRPETALQLKLQKMADASVQARKLQGRTIPASQVVQRAGRGELHLNDIVEADDDGTLCRGVFLREEPYDDDYVIGVFRVTHVNDVACREGESWDAELNLNKIHLYAGAPAIKTIPEGGVSITHFAPARVNNERVGAEYIVPHAQESVGGGITPRNNIEVTNHGLGSGIYGLVGWTPEQIQQNEQAHNSRAYTIPMTNPLYLQDAAHGGLFTALSKRLQRAAMAIRATYSGILSHYGVSEWVEKNGAEVTALTDALVAVLARVGREPGEAAIETALFKFFVAYNSAASGGTLVAQPINFLMTDLGYDGVFGDNDSDNSFGRGSVLYQLPEGTRKESHVDRIAH